GEMQKALLLHVSAVRHGFELAHDAVAQDAELPKHLAHLEAVSQSADSVPGGGHLTRPGACAHRQLVGDIPDALYEVRHAVDQRRAIESTSHRQLSDLPFPTASHVVAVLPKKVCKATRLLGMSYPHRSPSKTIVTGGVGARALKPVTNHHTLCRTGR